MSVLECETITCYTRVTEGVHSGYTPRKSFFIAIPTNPAAGNSVVLPVFMIWVLDKNVLCSLWADTPPFFGHMTLLASSSNLF